MDRVLRNFVRALRNANLRVSTSETLDALQTVNLIGYSDKATLKTLPPGSVYTEPAGAPHFAMTGNEAVTVLIIGYGPTDTV